MSHDAHVEHYRMSTTIWTPASSTHNSLCDNVSSFLRRQWHQTRWVIDWGPAACLERQCVCLGSRRSWSAWQHDFQPGPQGCNPTVKIAGTPSHPHHPKVQCRLSREPYSTFPTLRMSSSSARRYLCQSVDASAVSSTQNKQTSLPSLDQSRRMELVDSFIGSTREP